MKGLYYTHICEETHRVSFDYQTLRLSDMQEEQLCSLLQGPAKRGFGLSINCVIEKDERGRIIHLDFRNKELAHHFLLFVETELIDATKATESRRSAIVIPFGPRQKKVSEAKNRIFL